MDKDTALRLALEAFNKLAAWNDGEVGSHMDEPYSAEVAREAITAIKEALAQPEQPKVRTGDCLLVGICASEGHKIQPQRTWVTLTEDEIVLISADCAATHQHTDIHFARAIEAELKEKNT